MDKEMILKDTALLQKYNQELLEIHLSAINEGNTADFFTVVKPFADNVNDVVERWKGNILQWIKKEHPKYLHPNQIENTIENLTTVSVQAFFPDTKTKRFKELIRSNQYILETIVNTLQQK
jgi:hypothetical protein